MSPAPAAADAATLARARAVAAALVGTVLLLAASVALLPRVPGFDALVVPATLAGVVSPAVGYRAYHRVRESVPAAATARDRRASFERATILALAITEAAALLGLLVAAFTDRPQPAIGVLTHVLLAGAIWPTDERLARFVRDGRDS